MANATIRGAASIHGTNPQFLIEKPVRARIYESPFWKEHCFALSASTILPLAVNLHHIGGLTGLQRPSHFLCLLQKLLQIQPEPEIIKAYLDARDFKYLRALTAFYIRLTYKSTDIYRLLEPLLEDGRKLRWRGMGGEYEILHLDEWVDSLLREERVCDIILPRLTKREVCESRDGLPPRISKLEMGFLEEAKEKMGEESDSGDEDEMSDVKRWKLERLQRATRLASLQRKGEGNTYQPAPAYGGDEAEYTSQEESDDGAERKRRRFISPSPSVSPDRQLAPRQAGGEEEEEEGGYVSRSPSRSPDRELAEGYVSRSPSRSPDRREEEEGYVSRSPSRSPDRI